MGLRYPAGSTAMQAESRKMVQTIVKTYVCPSRGNSICSPMGGVTNIGTLPTSFARSDDAANRGTKSNNSACTDSDYATQSLTGVIYERNGIKLTAILDGLSNTYLAGERYIDPDFYRGGETGNDSGWAVGHDFDVFRCTNPGPQKDTPGYLPLTEDTRFNDLGKQRKIAQTTNNGLTSPRIAENHFYKSCRISIRGGDGLETNDLRPYA